MMNSESTILVDVDIEGASGASANFKPKSASCDKSEGKSGFNKTLKRLFDS